MREVCKGWGEWNEGTKFYRTFLAMSPCDDSKFVKLIRENLLDTTDKEDTLRETFKMAEE